MWESRCCGDLLCDFSCGVEELNLRGPVGSYLEDDAIAALGVFELKRGGVVFGATEQDAGFVAGVFGTKLLPFGFLLCLR